MPRSENWRLRLLRKMQHQMMLKELKNRKPARAKS